MFPKVTKVHDGRRLIVDQLPLVYHPPPEEKVPEACYDAIQKYRETLPYERRILLDRYHIEDIAIESRRCRECRDTVWCGAHDGRG